MIIPAGYAQVNYQFEGAQVPSGAELTIGVQVVDAHTPQELADACSSIFVTDIIPVLNNTVTLTNTLIKGGPNDTGPTADHPSSVAGGFSNPGATPNMALLVKKSTGTGGRRGQGRWFVPGVAEAWVDPSGNVTSAVIAAYNAALVTYLDDMTTEGIPCVLLHAASSVLGAPAPPAPYLITAMTCQAVAATQRRRMRR
jgi:hypothetical protein